MKVKNRMLKKDARKIKINSLIKVWWGKDENNIDSYEIGLVINKDDDDLCLFFPHRKENSRIDWIGFIQVVKIIKENAVRNTRIL